jgi:molybdenum cofactor synthesis domain-containing protein
MDIARNPTAALIIVGNEILSGRTQDANLPFIAKELGAVGIRLTEARVVQDVEAAIVEAVNTLRARHDYVFTTGGIGPTHDDITAACVAKAFGLALERNAEAERRLLAYYPPEKVNPARMKMADAPPGAELIDNPVSVAPGFRIENVYVLPGVPKIMAAMFEGLRGKLRGGAPVLARTIVLRCPEGTVAARLGEIQTAHPTTEIGSYPFMNMDRPGTSIVFRGTDRADIEAASASLLGFAGATGIVTEDQGFS